MYSLLLCWLSINRQQEMRVQETGVFVKKSESRTAQEQMMTNPDMMTNMLKQSVGGFLPQVRRQGLGIMHRVSPRHSPLLEGWVQFVEHVVLVESICGGRALIPLGILS